MSTHSVTVFKVNRVNPHPNADKLDILQIDGYSSCVAKGEFKEGDLAVFIEPDSIVDTARPEFAFLKEEGKTHRRIKARKLRQVVSYGLVIPLPEHLKNAKEGDDVMEQLGITSYQPPIEAKTSGQFEQPPAGIFTPVMDIENYRKYGHKVLVPGEEIIFSEKLHGTSARFVYAEDRTGERKLFTGSHYNWFKPSSDNLYTRMPEVLPQIKLFCEENFEMILFGEIFGQVKGYDYGCIKGVPGFAAFDIYFNGQWLQDDMFRNLCDKYNIPTVPILYHGPYSDEVVNQHCVGNTTFPGKHIREGGVIKVAEERSDILIGRVQLKLVSPDYLAAK